MGSYSISKTCSLDTLKGVFPNGEADSMNWLVLSTSGVHGTYTDLDEIEKKIEAGGEGDYITILIIKPRIVEIVYGHVFIETLSDIKWMRGVVSSTIEAIDASQSGNKQKGESTPPTTCCNAPHRWVSIQCGDCKGQIQQECSWCNVVRSGDYKPDGYDCYCDNGNEV